MTGPEAWLVRGGVWLGGACCRVHDGSVVLAGRYGAWLGCWRAGPAARRVAGSGVVAWLGAVTLDRATALLWPLAVWWCWAAWRAGDGDLVPARHEVPPTLCAEYRAALLAWLDLATRGRSGIHLAELYARLRQHPALAHLADPELRACLAHYGVPVRRSLRVDGVAGRTGVHRADIEALLTLPSPAESGPLSRCGEPGQAVDSPPVESGGERPGKGLRKGVDGPCDA